MHERSLFIVYVESSLNPMRMQVGVGLFLIVVLIESPIGIAKSGASALR